MVRKLQEHEHKAFPGVVAFEKFVCVFNKSKNNTDFETKNIIQDKKTIRDLSTTVAQASSIFFSVNECVDFGHSALGRQKQMAKLCLHVNKRCLR